MDNVTVHTALKSTGGWNSFGSIPSLFSIFFVTAVPNLLITLSVLRYRALQQCKEYLIISALCFADFTNVFAYAGSGFNRILLITKGSWFHKISAWSCITYPINILFWFSTTSHSLMLVIVSLDRLLAVSFPCDYIAFTLQYAYCMVGSTYGYSIVMVILALGFGYRQQNNDSRLMPSCFTGQTVLSINDVYAFFFLYVEPFSGVVSIVLYIARAVVYRKKKNQVQKISKNSQQGEESYHQRRLTRTVGWSCVCTTVFVIVPVFVTFTGDVFNLPRSILQPFWLLPPINSLCNVIIFYNRVHDLKEGVISMLTCRSMPSNITTWCSNRKASSRRIQRNHKQYRIA